MNENCSYATQAVQSYYAKTLLPFLFMPTIMKATGKFANCMNFNRLY